MLSYRANKAKALLNHIADAFSVAPRDFRVIPTLHDNNHLELTDASTTNTVLYHNKTQKKRSSEVSHPGDDLAWDETQTSIYSGISGATIINKHANNSINDDSIYQFQFSGVSPGVPWDGGPGGAGVFDEVSLCGLEEYMKSVYSPNLSTGRVKPNLLGRYMLQQRLLTATGTHPGQGGGNSTTTTTANTSDSTGGGSSSSVHDYDGSDFYIIGTGSNTASNHDGMRHQRGLHMEAIQKLRLLASTSNPSTLDFAKLMESTRVLGTHRGPFRLLLYPVIAMPGNIY